MGDWGGTRTEVPPTLDQPASQQGGGGKVEKPDRRSQGGDGGAMDRAGIFGASGKVKVSIQSSLIPITCVLWIGGETMYQFSAESNGIRGFG